MFQTAAKAALKWRKSGDPDALHDLRVAARRYRAAVRFFSPLLKDVSVRRVLQATDRLAAVSGPVRDADMLAGFGHGVRGDAASDTPERKRLRRFLAGHGFRALRAKAAALHKTGHALRSRSDTPSFGAFAVLRMKDRINNLAGYDLPGDIDRPNRVHVVRKRVRRLRYWAEMTAPACGARMEELATCLHNLATALGLLHDVDVATESLRQDSGSLRELRLRRTRKVKSAWRALTGHKGLTLVGKAMAAAKGNKIP
jgi:CHAD domain-containing protein